MLPIGELQDKIMSQGNVVVVFDETGAMSSPFDKLEYYHAYSELFRILRDEYDCDAYIARGPEIIGPKQIFSDVWSWDANDKLIQMQSAVHADVIYDKSLFFVPEKEAVVINSNELKNICFDKLKTQELFEDISPKTEIVHSAEILAEKLLKYDSKVVVKPIDGARGVGVQVAESDSINIQKVKYPCILQEYLDSSNGIPGITKGFHDLRVIVAGGEIIYSYVRIPKQGTFISNVHQGGELAVVDIASLSETCIEFVKSVDKRLSKYNERLYAIDMILTPSGYRLVELNSQPGVSIYSDSNEQTKYLKKIASHIKKLIKTT